MNEQALRIELKRAMAHYREKSFTELAHMIHDPQKSIAAVDGEAVGCRIEVMWADFAPGLITVFGSARERPNSRLKRWLPFLSHRIVETFTVSPENKIVDEESL